MRRNRMKELGTPPILKRMRRRKVEDTAGGPTEGTQTQAQQQQSLFGARKVRIRSNGRKGRTDGTMLAGYVMVFLDPTGRDAGQHPRGYHPHEIEYLDGESRTNEEVSR